MLFTEDADYLQREYIPALKCELEGARRAGDTDRAGQIIQQIRRFEQAAGLTPRDALRHAPMNRAHRNAR